MKRAFAVFAFGIYTVTALSGCNTLSSVSSADKFSDSYVRAHLVERKTSKSEVVSLYGEPDSKNNYSDGEATYYYKKHSYHEDLNSLYDLANTIPGASSVQNAIGTVRGKTYDVNQASNSVNKLAGNKSQSDNNDSLRITFDKNGIISNWSN